MKADSRTHQTVPRVRTRVGVCLWSIIAPVIVDDTETEPVKVPIVGNAASEIDWWNVATGG